MIGSGLPASGLAPVALVLTALVLTGCSSTTKEMDMSGTYEGPPVALGEGEAWTFITLDEKGEARKLGIRFSEAALSGLPTTAPPSGEWEHELELPAEAAGTGYDHVKLGWNPHGHPPEGVYDVPHFDFHFFAIDSEAVNAITAVGEDLERAHKAPPEGYMPSGYVLPPGTEVPKMGAHAIDPAGDEFQKKPFTKTFIYGFYDGKVIFMEPMMTLDYLASRPNVMMAIKQPEAYQKEFAYPGGYGVHFDESDRRYEVTLDNLTWH